MKDNKIENIRTATPKRFSYHSVLPFFTIMGLYSLWVIFALKGFRFDHVLLLVGATAIYFFSETSRKFVLGFGFLILYWFIFDSIRLFPNYEYNTIHIGDLYELEKSLFGLNTPEGRITLNEYFATNNSTFLDIYSAIIYISWIPLPFLFGLYLFFTKQRIKLVHFWFAFLMVSVFGLVLQYLYPAAAPWYVELYGTEGAFQKVPGNPGRLINFDKFFGVNVFGDMYSLNANVYAAVPSLHCAFPIIQLFFAVKHKFKIWTVVFTILMLSTWFSAIYTNHHYTIDVLAGVSTAIFTVVVYSLLQKTKVKTWLDNYGKQLF